MIVEVQVNDVMGGFSSSFTTLRPHGFVEMGEEELVRGFKRREGQKTVGGQWINGSGNEWPGWVVDDPKESRNVWNFMSYYCLGIDCPKKKKT